MYKLVALDIDGTLLDKNRNISLKTGYVLKQISKLAKVLLISSRMPAAMRYIQEECGISKEPLVAYNGGLIMHKEKILSQTVIELEVLNDILEINSKLGVHLSLFHNDEWYAPQQDYWSKREINNTRVQPVFKSNKEVLENWTLEQKAPHKIMCMGEASKIDELYQSLVEKFEDKIHLYRSKSTYIEIAPKQISKLSGVHTIINEIHKGIELKNVVAYGDNFNDIEMLENVGLGVAVANAKQEVLQIADQLTSSNVDDGVAIHLEKIFKL